MQQFLARMTAYDILHVQQKLEMVLMKRFSIWQNVLPLGGLGRIVKTACGKRTLCQLRLQEKTSHSRSEANKMTGRSGSAAVDAAARKWSWSSVVRLNPVLFGIRACPVGDSLAVIFCMLFT